MDEKQMLAHDNSVIALIGATKLGDIRWKKQNPTTYYYESTPSAITYTTSIQSLTGGDFVLLIYEKESKDVILDLNSNVLNKSFIGSQLSIKLQVLFNSIAESINQRSVDVFESIIKNISK